MTLRETMALASVLAAASCAAGCTMAPKPLVVKCSINGDLIDVVSLDIVRGQATLLSVSPPVTGSVRATPSEYEILFQPGPDGAPRLSLRINRYTFRAAREVGSGAAPATAGSASVSTGTCERYKDKPL